MDILITDDHALIRDGLQYVLRQLDREVTILEASSCAGAVDIAKEHGQLDLILLDLSMPDTAGIEALIILRDCAPSTPIVVVSGSEDRATINNALNCGAQGYIPKSSSSQIMLGALRLVFAGGIYLPPQLRSSRENDPHLQASGEHRPAAGYAPKPHDSDSQMLTLRQLEVLSLVCKGLSNKEICRELGLAEGTVKVHVTAILKALAVSNRTQAAMAAREIGLTGIMPDTER